MPGRTRQSSAINQLTFPRSTATWRALRKSAFLEATPNSARRPGSGPNQPQWLGVSARQREIRPVSDTSGAPFLSGSTVTASACALNIVPPALVAGRRSSLGCGGTDQRAPLLRPSERLWSGRGQSPARRSCPLRRGVVGNHRSTSSGQSKLPLAFCSLMPSPAIKILAQCCCQTLMC